MLSLREQVCSAFISTGPFDSSPPPPRPLSGHLGQWIQVQHLFPVLGLLSSKSHHSSNLGPVDILSHQWEHLQGPGQECSLNN